MLPIQLVEADHIKCAHPFNGLFLEANADLKTCCAGQCSLGNANTDNISDVYNGGIAREIREAMLKNEWHPNCYLCKEIEELGGKSTRNTEFFRTDPSTLTADTYRMEVIDLRWNNTCNLMCTYCMPKFSNKWAKALGSEITKVTNDKEDQLFDFLEEHKESLTRAMLLGGEPTLHLQNIKLMENYPHLHYTMLSNLAISNIENNPVVKKMLEIEHFNWGVSFENVGEKFEYVRFGANWDTFVHNIKYVQEKVRENGNVLTAHPLFCLFSAYDLVDFYDFVTENNLFNGGISWQLLLHNGGAICNMTKKFKENAIIEIDRCITKYPDAMGINMLLDFKNQLINDLENPDDMNYMREVVQYIDRVDKHLSNRLHNFKDLWHDEWKLLMEGANYES